MKRESWIRLYLRELRRRPGFLIFGLLWMGGWWGVVAGVVHHLGNPLQESRLEQAGFRVQGPITDIKGESPSVITYEFLDFGGRKFTGKSNVWEPNHVRALSRSGIATVVYLPTRPEVSKLQGERYSSLDLWKLYLLIGLGCLAFPVMAKGLITPYTKTKQALLAEPGPEAGSKH